MALWLRQSTNPTTITLGPIVDSLTADPETGLSITQTDVQLRKHGSGGFGSKNESTSCTDVGSGFYTCPLDATDTNTLGQLVVRVAKTGTLVYRGEFMVVPANVWDSMFGTDKLQTDAVELYSDATAAANLRSAALMYVNGTVTGSPTATEFTASGFTEATNDHFIGRIIMFLTGNLKYQATSITDYVGATQTFTVDALTEAPAAADTFIIV